MSGAEELDGQVTLTNQGDDDVSLDDELSIMWLLFGTYLVFFMQVM